MNPIKFRAPGKLFLLGEYVVLFGGPAVLISVDRYINVTLEAHAGPYRIRSEGADMNALEGRWQAGKLHWDGITKDHALVLAVITQLTEDGTLHPSLPPFEACIDSSELFVDGQKLGLGSSAAVTHALARAIVDYANECEAADRPRHRLSTDWVFNVHRAYQQGRGSGADVAAGVVGGAYVFTRLSDHWIPQIRPIELPANLHCRYIWVGQAASTQSALDQLQAYQQANPVHFTHCVTPLMALAEQGVTALTCGDADAFSAICQRYCHNLSEFGRTVGIDVVSQVHADLSQLAQSVGVAYKPSGAGTGDFGIAFSSNINNLDEFQRRIKQTDGQSIPLSLGKPCHRIE